MISGSRRDSVGGGGSSRNFLWSPNGVAIQWGGGGTRIFFSVISKRRRDSVGGGSTIHFSLMGPFYIFFIFKRGAPFCILGIFNRGDPLFHFWDFQKGGARAPRAPPLNRPLGTTVHGRLSAVKYCTFWLF